MEALSKIAPSFISQLRALCANSRRPCTVGQKHVSRHRDRLPEQLFAGGQRRQLVHAQGGLRRRWLLPLLLCSLSGLLHVKRAITKQPTAAILA